MSFPAVYGWIAQHPHLAGFAVFLTALAESLAVVGLLVPGVAMMFAAGAMVGAGALAFWPVCAYAVAGAIAGDGLSFWLGWHFRDRLAAVWPFSRYPAMIERGVAFFQRYGGRGVLFGRFVGPVRAVIPLAAGMLEMPVARFLAVNIVSALLWAPAYLLPGMAFGASMDLAARIAERLAALAIVFLAALWFTAWLAKRLYAYFQPRAHGFILDIFDFGRDHPWLGRLAFPLVDPDRRDYPGLALWAVLLGGLGLALCWLAPPGVVPVALGAWRNPWADYALTVGGELGGASVVAAVGLWIGGYLWLTKLHSAAGHLLAGIGFAVGLGWTCGQVSATPELDSAVLNAAVAYGFVAILLADQAGAAWRWAVYAMAALLVGAVGFARLYAGSQGLLAVGFPLALGLVWLLVLGVAYRRHRPATPPVKGLFWQVSLALATVALALWQGHSAGEFARPPVWVTVGESAWLDGGWKDLPAHRARIFGHPNQALALQWAAPLDGIRAGLVRDGWRAAQPLSAGAALGILNPDADIAGLPVLPHFNQAEADVLRMIKPVPGGRWLIARFWASGLETREGAVPIWLGSVAFLEARAWLGLLKVAEEKPGEAGALALFEAGFGAGHLIDVRVGGGGRTVLLLRD